MKYAVAYEIADAMKYAAAYRGIYFISYFAVYGKIFHNPKDYFILRSNISLNMIEQILYLMPVFMSTPKPCSGFQAALSFVAIFCT